MEIFIAIAIVIMLALQGLNYYSLAYIFSWLRARVIQPEQVVDPAEQSDDQEPEDSSSRGMYL